VTERRQRLGRRAERLAAETLAARGYSILERNVRVPGIRGEIDLIAIDRGALVFIEVKARNASAVGGPETPVLSVGHRKQAKLRALAAAWLAQPQRPGGRRWCRLRFDVIGVTLDPAGSVVEWRHLVAAF
jgi:putative endonuclease